MRDTEFMRIKPGMELLVKGERYEENFRCIAKGYPYCIQNGKKHIWGILTQQGFVKRCNVLIAVGEGIALSGGNLEVLLEQLCREKSVDYPCKAGETTAQGRDHKLDRLRRDLRYAPWKILDFLQNFETEHDYALHSTGEYDQWYMDELLITHIKKTLRKMEQDDCEYMKAGIIREVYKDTEVRRLNRCTRDKNNPNKVNTLELFMRFAKEYLQLAKYVKDPDELAALREGMDRGFYLFAHENLVDFAEHIRYTLQASRKESVEGRELHSEELSDYSFLGILEGEDLQIDFCCNKID